MISIDELIVGLPKIHANQIQPKAGDETKSTEECALIAGLIKYAHLQAGIPALVKVGLKTISFWQGFPSFLSRPVKMKIHSSEKLRAAGLISCKKVWESFLFCFLLTKWSDIWVEEEDEAVNGLLHLFVEE